MLSTPSHLHTSVHKCLLFFKSRKTHFFLLSLKSVSSLGEVSALLGGLGGLGRSLGRGESSSDGSGLLTSQILGHELLVLVELSDLLSLGQVENGQNSGNVLSHVVDLGELSALGSSELLDSESGELGLELDELALELSLGKSREFGSLHFGLG